MADATPILVPDLGTETVTFGIWLVTHGERVSENDRIAELLIPGACVDLISPANGIVLHGAGTGDIVQRGDMVGAVR